MPNLQPEPLLYFNKQLWGKYDSINGYHPAVYHMLDVALVAQSIFSTLNNKEQALLIRPFANSKNPLAVLLFFIALHDLGKLTPGFQLKIPEWRQRLKSLEFTWSDELANQHQNTIHGFTGFFLLVKLLESCLNLHKEPARALANSVAGHHGSFFNGDAKWQFGEGQWQEARTEAVQWLQLQLGVLWSDIQIDTAKLNPAYVVYLAGFCAVSDWLGSDETTFNYLNEGDYNKPQRQQLAHKQIGSLPLKQAGLAAGQSCFEAIFSFKPNATQQITLDLFSRIVCPTLTIIETPMGSGKTEAALALADKYIREQGKTGFYFALPTQATGNQLFERTVAFLKQHPAKTSDLEMHLRHANASLNAQYEALQASSINHDEREGVVASRWFTANKRGLLSAYAVGTVDQCLIGALQARHFFVRLFGLSNKVIVIDEVHAYGLYTSRILEALLEWLAVLDAPVILLSATLPAARRKALMSAYHKQDIVLQGDAQNYPRITCLGSSGHYSEAHVIDDQSTLPTAFHIKLVETSLKQRWERVKAILDNDLGTGGCAACIVNTVKDAQGLFEVLHEYYQHDNSIQLILFHARFPLFKRLKIEQAIKDLFGKGDTDLPNLMRPTKAIVVATQVLEQSLDVDFDLMISMLAPVDLLLQRSGRVHRHAKNHSNRPKSLEKPVIYCLHPKIDKDSDDARTVFGNAEAYIYEPYCLFYTVLSLKNRAEFTSAYPLVTVNMPEDLEPLIDEVYEGKLAISDEAYQTRGEIWELEAKQKHRVEAQFADAIKLPSPHSRLRTFFRNLEKAEDDEKIALTRLALPSIALVLMRLNDAGQWCLLEDNAVIDLKSKPDKVTQHKLIRSSVRISHAGWVEYFSKKSATPTTWQKVAVLHDCYPLQLIEDAFHCLQVKGRLIWQPNLGLVIVDA